MVLWLKPTLGMTNLIYGMYIQNLALEVTWVGWLHLAPLVCKKKKKFQITLGPKELDQQTHFNIYFGL